MQLNRLTAISYSALSLLGLGILSSSTAYSESTYELEKTSVFGVDSNISHLSQQPVRVEMITKAELEATHAIDLKDALKYTAGIQMRQLRGKSGEGVWLQGYDSDRVAVLVDGLPVAAGTGSSVDINQIAIGDVERIEVSKGAMSAIYGTSAMGGVVNVITKAPQQGQQASLTYTGGTWGSQDESNDRVPMGKQHVQAGYSFGNAHTFGQIFIDEQTSNGFRIEGSDETQGWQGNKLNTSIKTVFTLNETTELTVSPRLYREDIQTINDNVIGGVGKVPKAKIDITEKDYASALLTKQVNDKSLFKLNYSFEDFQNESRQDTIQTERIEQSRTTDIEHSGVIAQYELSPNYVNKYVLGIEYLNDSMNVKTRKEESSGATPETIEVNDKQAINRNAFFQLSRQIDPEVEMLISGRLNDNPKYGRNFSPMLNFQFLPMDLLPGDLSFRFGYGHGYRTPNIKELYYFFDHSHLGYIVVGNENLQPESSKNWQASMEWQPNKQTSFDISFFHNRIKDLISSDYEDPELTEEFSNEYGSTVTGNQYTNIENAITQGTELTLSYVFNDHIKYRFGYAYLSSEDEKTGNVLTQRPEHDIKLSLDASITEKTLATVKYNYSSEQYSDSANLNETPAFSQIDLKLNYDLNKNIKLFGGVNNLTAEQKETFDGKDLRPDEGRYTYVGITIKN